jgi:hypothetical protein
LKLRNLKNLLPLAALASATGFAQEPEAVRPQMSATVLSSPPAVDGNVLADLAWSTVIPAGQFWQTQPHDGAPASQRTEVRIGYTETALYIGVVAFDSDPSAIVVNDSRRDSQLDDMDAFLVLIDGLLDRQNGFVFGTNPAGIEYDGQVTREGAGGMIGFGGGNLNLNWDGSWSVESTVGDYGWSAEFEIPFRTLRYRPGSAAWGINFQRNIRRNNEVVFWAPLDRNHSLYRVSDAGTLNGVDAPAQQNLKVTPYVLGDVRRGGELSGSVTETEVGLDIKYSITPSLTLDLTVNTDFAQVEADDQQLNLDRFNLFFPEKRPFFLENAGLFAVGDAREVDLFFSRRIGISEDGDPIPIAGGARLSGKVGGSTNVGLLYLETDGVNEIAAANHYQVARVSHELPNRSSLGAIFIGRDGDGSFEIPATEDHNRTYGIDGQWGIGDNLLIKGWAAQTETPGYDERDDAFGIRADYNSEQWTYNLSYTEVGADFNPEVGFLARSDYRKLNGFLLRRIRPDDLGNILELRPHASYTAYWDFDGFQETGILHIDNHWVFNSGTLLVTGVNVTRSGIKEEFDIVEDVWVQPGTYDHAEGQFGLFSDGSKPFSFGIMAVAGGRFGGKRLSVSPSVTYRAGDKFLAQLSASYNEFDLPVENGDFTANLGSLRLSYSFSPKIQLQTLIQYNSTSEKLGANVRFSWLRSANSGLYVVYNQLDERAEVGLPPGRELLVKYSYIFDVFH